MENKYDDDDDFAIMYLYHGIAVQHVKVNIAPVAVCLWKKNGLITATVINLHHIFDFEVPPSCSLTS
jgi:hypothetical protein